MKALTARHRVLRTSIDVSRFSRPLQLVHREAPVDVEVHDLRSMPADEQKRTLELWHDRERAQGFDVTRPGLVRIRVHRCGDEILQFHLVEHHAILDGWSVAVLLEELFQRYAGRLQSAPDSPLPADDLFRDYVAAEQAALTAPAMERYWRHQVEDLPLGRLPWTDGRTATASAEPGERSVAIAAHVTAGLDALAASVGVSIKTVLLAAHMRVIAGLTGQRDVLTGLVSNGRPEVEGGERALGLFLNTVPLSRSASGRDLAGARRRCRSARSRVPAASALPGGSHPAARRRRPALRDGIQLHALPRS